MQARVSLPVRGAWIEIHVMILSMLCVRSLPVRGAWIEIVEAALDNFGFDVAPCEGSVD